MSRSVVRARMPSRKAGRVGGKPRVEAMGSMITQARSLALRRTIRSHISRSFQGRTTTSSSRLGGWPGNSSVAGGPSGPYGSADGFTLTEAYSCEPWYAPENLAILCLPVKVRAARIALSVASVPEFTKRTLSSDGTLSHRMRARRIALSFGPTKPVPRPACSAMASTTMGLAWPMMRLVAFSMKSR